MRDCSRSNDTLRCMTCNAYHEARGDASIVEVNRTVIARTESGQYPKNICDVIYQRKQFSWTFQNKLRACLDDASWNKSAQAAAEAIKKGSNGHLNYYRFDINPKWARNCHPKKRIGDHLFCTAGAGRVASRSSSNSGKIKTSSTKRRSAKSKSRSSRAKRSRVKTATYGSGGFGGAVR